jgi:signal transduction histidine kinase
MSLRLWPRDMTGRMMLITALGVLLVQAINTAMRYQAIQARMVVESASHLAATVANQLERLETGGAASIYGKRQVAIVVSSQPMQPEGFESTDELAERVAAPLQSIYPQVASVRLSIGSIDQLPPSLGQNAMRPFRPKQRWRYNGDGLMRVLLLTLRMDDGRWVHAVFRVRQPTFRPFLVMLVETLLIYLGVLIPLLLVIRQISKPLHRLNHRLASAGLASGAAPLEPGGPDDVRSLIESFNAAEQRVAAMLTEKDVMLGAIGHDLKTPLAALRVRIESVDDETERTKMADSVDEMVSILDDILMLARLGKSQEALQLVDLGALVEDVCAEIAGAERLQLIQPDTKLRAKVRPMLLRRAIRNLANNALQYGERAQLTLRETNGFVDITIDDEGPGLPPEQLERMFEPFVRAEESRNRAHGGTGLGLTIARAIARSHGGDVILENRDERGLRATLRIAA